MKISNKNIHGELALSELENFESTLGVILPEEYREFLLEYNGGEPDPNTFDVPREGADTFSFFLGIHEGPEYANLIITNKTFEGRVPKQLLVIGGDNVGNQVCIGIKGRYREKIYFWDHEKEGAFFKFSAVKLLAKSFNLFLESLYEYEDPEESNLLRIIKKKDLEGLSELVESGFDIESRDEYNRTPIEVCAIHASNELIRYLYEKGANLGGALALAERNAEFFEGHKETVRLIEELGNKS